MSRLTRVKPQQSEWLFTELFSAECGSSLNISRVASAELNVYPYIIPAWKTQMTQMNGMTQIERNDWSDQNDPKDPNDPNDLNELNDLDHLMTESFADNWPYGIFKFGRTIAYF